MEVCRLGKVVAFINYKGGVGKTTLAVETSASLAHHHGKRSLLVDLDPQANATFYLMREKDWEKWDGINGSLRQLFSTMADSSEFDIRRAIKKEFIFPPRSDRPIPLDLLPSHLNLLRVDLELASRYGPKGFGARAILRKALAEVKEEYAYVICDCPPNLNLVTQNAMVASDAVVIVAMPEYLSTLGIALIQRAVEEVVADINRDLEAFTPSRFAGPKVKGIIFNRVRTLHGGTLYQQEVIERVKRQYPGLVFETFLPATDRLARRGEDKVPLAVSGYAVDDPYEQRLLACAREFMRRIDAA